LNGDHSRYLHHYFSQEQTCSFQAFHFHHCDPRANSRAADASVMKHWIAVAQQAEKAKRLLVPTVQDWIEAGKILNRLLRGLKSKNKGKTPKLPGQETQRIIRDVLIARCVKRAGGTLVTDNLKDFNAIQRFCRVKIRSGRQFFG
jgi:predicted nucleic acid-binding protein